MRNRNCILGASAPGLLFAAAASILLPNGSAAGQHQGHETTPVKPFDAVFIQRSRTIRLQGSPDEVFPLFTPEGRQEWSTFRPVMLRKPVSGWEGAVYQEATIHEEPNTALVADFDPLRRFIRYVTFIPGSEAWEMEIHVGPLDDGAYATITYRVTSLSEAANPEIAEFFDGHFEAAIDGWAAAIDRHLGY